METVQQISLFDPGPAFPESREALKAFFEAYILENEKDEDAFTLRGDSASVTCSFYGTKVMEMNFAPSPRMKLPGWALRELGTERKNLSENAYYAVPALTGDRLLRLAELMKARKRTIFRKLKGENFSCCNSFRECSDAKHCLHEDDRFYNGCEYRRSLENGRIFFGANRNID